MDIKRAAWKIFSIQGDEFDFTIPLFFLYFLSGAFFATGQIYSETLFLKTYGAQHFSHFFIRNGIALIFAGILYNYFILKLPLRKGYYVLIISIVLLLSSSLLLMNRKLQWLPFYIYMGNYLFTFFLDIHFFNFSFQFLSLRNSKRILPLLMSGGKLGGIVAGLLIFTLFS
ncbi:MAG: hypothetical protein GY754_16235, partial [bacterium]|nr:hypothetical protein [bacterium]